MAGLDASLDGRGRSVIRDRDRLARGPDHASALDCLEAGVAAADPAAAVRAAVSVDGDRLVVDGDGYNLADYDEVVLLGAGKAAGGAAAALESILGGRLDRGVVVVPEPLDDREAGRVEVLVGGHPLPDAGSEAGATRLLDLAEAADGRTLVLAVIGGGGSALLAAPIQGVSLDDLRATTEALLEAGVDVDGINAVRKHLSAVKGGGLARAAAPATVVGLLASDVVGDDPGVIASGPTAPDETTFADALDAVERHDVAVPDPVRERLDAGAAGRAPETPGADDPAFDRVRNHVVLGGWTALAAASEAAADRGFPPCVLSSRVRGESREAALAHVAVAEEVAATGNPVGAPVALLSGGECTVSVRGDGAGGPNLEFALRAAIELAAGGGTLDGAVVAAVDTDGHDGSTDAAGAIVDADTVDDVGAARRALEANDAAGYLGEHGALLVTGTTGTNVNDLRVLLVPE